MSGPPPQAVGNGTDYTAQVSTPISSATGSFDNVSAGATETGLDYVTNVPNTPNIYSLQLNSAPFATPVCAGHGSGCLGWEQFIYTASANQVLIQFWLISYSGTCPAGWSSYLSDCYFTTRGSTLSGGPPPVATLHSNNVTLTGSANVSGNDTVVMTTTAAGNPTASATSADSMLGLSGAWKAVEFAIVGDCCDAQATFNAGTSVQVRTTVHDGTMIAPTCVLEGFTGETNNLDLSAPPVLGVQAAPTMVSVQTNSSPLPHGCATASSWGDTHLISFTGLQHDFQASGDFDLLTTGPGFAVETRQVPYVVNPNVTINKAVGVQVGKSQVSLCLDPTRLFINRRPAHLASGGRRALPGGGDVLLNGNTYLIRDSAGDDVDAQVLFAGTDYLSLFPGLGHWPAVTRGLLASVQNNPGAVRSRAGVVLTAPFNFNQYYDVYGDSWHASQGSSLLSPCGHKVLTRNPRTTVNVANLKPGIAKAAMAACRDAHVRDAPLLDACTLDVAILRSKAAAQVYKELPTKVSLGRILSPRN